MTGLVGGIDFGTSNSSVGCLCKGEPTLIQFGSDGNSVPSAVFYENESLEKAFGKQAVSQYLSGLDGRLLRSLKSVLGTSLMSEKTTIRNRRVPFTDIIQDFFQYLRQTLDNGADGSVERVVVGRPVHFVDDDVKRDVDAENQLKVIALQSGFTDVEFQFEPIAAALAYESALASEQLALVVDIGGGTADFTIIRLSPERRLKASRADDILSTTGVHLGGTDFDRLLSLSAVMPLLGMGSGVVNSDRLLPGSVYFDLATWHRIPLLYNASTLTQVKQMKLEAIRKDDVQILIDVLEGQYGHQLAGAVEQSKIELSDELSAQFSLEEVSTSLQSSITRDVFENAIADCVEQLIACIKESMSSAGVQSAAITSIFYTGGSSAIPLLKSEIDRFFPSASSVSGDAFGSVGLGLTIDAARKFS